MAEVIERPPAKDLCENDFALWTECQAALLRTTRFDELDLENLIEEVEDLGRRERDMVESHLETILEHLLKLSHAARPRRGWLVTVDRQQARLARKLTTTLRHHLEAVLPGLYAGLRRPVARQLEKADVSLDALPPTCPYSLDQLLNADWYPDSRRGAEEPKA
jgi:hypothetical protein